MSAKKKASKAAQVAELRKKKASKPAGKAAKVKKPKAKKPDLAVVERTGIGHNSDGSINQPLVEIMERIEAIRDNKKELAKAERDEIAKARTEHNVSSAVLKHELRLRQMDSDVRAQFETGHSDLKNMIGVQMILPLNEDGEPGEGETQETADTGEDTGSGEELEEGNGYN